MDQPLAGWFASNNGSSSQAQAFVRDEQGTVRAAIRPDGTREDDASTYSRNPFGGLETGVSGATHTGTGYTGASTPNGSGGFTYLRNRWYDPQTGRFLTQDPIGLAGGVNLYAYAGNNPVSFSDPFGLCVPMPWCLLAALRGAVAAAPGAMRSGASIAVGFVPGFGDAVDIGGAAVGRDLITSERMSTAGRAATVVGTILGSGKLAREGVDAGAGALRRQFDNVVRPNHWKGEAANSAGSYSADNVARMGRGLAPIGSDGYPMELHHRVPLANGGTNDPSNLQAMTRTEHRLGENYSKNHPDLPEEE